MGTSKTLGIKSWINYIIKRNGYLKSMKPLNIVMDLWWYIIMIKDVGHCNQCGQVYYEEHPRPCLICGGKIVHE